MIYISSPLWPPILSPFEGYYQYQDVAEAGGISAASAAAVEVAKGIGARAASAAAKAAAAAALKAATVEAAADRDKAAAFEPQSRQREFFEFLQVKRHLLNSSHIRLPLLRHSIYISSYSPGDAERSLDRLHEAAEKQLQEIVNDSSRNFQVRYLLHWGWLLLYFPWVWGLKMSSFLPSGFP